MKKRTMRERREAFKQAYYAELNKQGIMDSEKKEETLTMDPNAGEVTIKAKKSTKKTTKKEVEE